MPMPTNCLDCPACNEYLMCAIPVNGRKWGENDVREYGQGRPEWCPLKEQEAVEPLPQNSNGWVRTIKLWYCGACHSKISRRTSKYCPNCGKPVLWKGR